MYRHPGRMRCHSRMLPCSFRLFSTVEARMAKAKKRQSVDGGLPALSLRIDLDADRRIGPGKIELLESINTCGSISAAGRAMDMSYKRAWDLVDEINRICG